MLLQSIQTPFGVLEAYLWSHLLGKTGITGRVFGVVTINRVEYRADMDLVFHSGSSVPGDVSEWRKVRLTLDRTDQNGAQFPHNAYNKFVLTVLPLWKEAVTEEHLRQAKEEERLNVIETLKNDINLLKEKIVEKEKLLVYHERTGKYDQ